MILATTRERQLAALENDGDEDAQGDLFRETRRTPPLTITRPARSEGQPPLTLRATAQAPDSGPAAIPVTLSPDGPVAIDFETYYDAHTTIKALGYWRYTHHPAFCTLLVGYATAAGSGALDPRLFPWEQLHGRQLLAHNTVFDRAVWDRLVEDNTIPRDVIPAGWSDTAALSRFFQCPGALDKAAKAILGIDLDKAPRNAAKGLTEATPELAAYCAKDAETCLALWTAAARLWPDQEQRLSVLTVEIGRRGLAVDPMAWRRLGEMTEALEAADAAMPWGDNAPPTSTKALADFCRLLGAEPPPSTDDSSPGLAAWMETAPPRCAEVVQAMQQRRRLARKVALLRAIHARTFPTTHGDRVESNLLYCGAAPGRWSGGGHGLNLQNLNNDAEFVDLRGMLVPAPGCVFLVVDLAQIEARCILWLAGDHGTLDQIRNGLGVYEAHARATMGWKGGVLKKEDPALYKLAKARVLGCGYGCGPAKFVAVAKAMAGLDLDHKEAAKTVRDYRKKNAPIVALWERLEAECRAARGGNYTLPLPSGRRITYRNVRTDEDGKLRAEQIKGTESFVYGGLLAENMTQAVARDVFADRLLALEDAGLRSVLLVHDEYVIESPAETAEADMARALAIVRTLAPWAAGLPVDAEGKIMAKRYGK